MEWADVFAVTDDWAEKAAAPAHDVRGAAAPLFTDTPVGYYYHPHLDKVAVYAPEASAADRVRCKMAACRAVGRDHVRGLFFSYPELSDPYGCWVKVAYSAGLRQLGEALNFFPGQYPGGLPNSPSPLAAMLTSGLVGAGLGWGAGSLAGKLLPGGYGDNLGRTGAVLGGLLGASPGALWAVTNKATGRPLNDPSLLAGRPGTTPLEMGNFADGANATPRRREGDQLSPVLRGLGVDRWRVPPAFAANLKAAADAVLGVVPLAGAYKAAAAKAAAGYGTFGEAQEREPSPADVNVDALGRTLYDAGASPMLAAAALGAMHAAQRMPDPAARPGWATGRQLAELAAAATGDYARGLLAGAAINAVVGTPWSAPAVATGAAALGVLGAVVPKLFGG